MGEFEIAENRPFYMTDAPETGGGPIRSVIVFRLRPLDATPPAGTKSQFPSGTHNITEIPP